MFKIKNTAISTKALLLTLPTLLTISGCEQREQLELGKAYAAKYLCSAVFRSQHDPELVKNTFIAPATQPLSAVWTVDIDDANKTVTVGDKIFRGESAKHQALFNPTAGCTLLVDKTAQDLANLTPTPLTPPTLDPNQPWPLGAGGIAPEPVAGIDYPRLEKAIDEAFTGQTSSPRNTTAVLVAYRGQLIAEKYALGAQPDLPLIGWSMTKSITSTLIGMLVDRQQLDIDAAAPIPAWQDTDKANITTRDLLHMHSGLTYTESTDTLPLMLKNGDIVKAMTDRALRAEPGFNYSTGDAVLIGHVVQNVLGGSPQAVYDFYQQELFHPIDITTASIEYDENGNLATGSSAFMSPRDWLRLGQLYLQRGNWRGQQIVSEDWIDFATTPGPEKPYYGAQIWLNRENSLWLGIPEDVIIFRGGQFQRVFIAPSQDLVIVRMGVTQLDQESDDIDPAGLFPLYTEIMAALPD